MEKIDALTTKTIALWHITHWLYPLSRWGSWRYFIGLFIDQSVDDFVKFLNNPAVAYEG